MEIRTTISFNRNEITKLYTETAGLSGTINSETYTYSEVGQPIGQFYGYNVIGMFTKEDDFTSGILTVIIFSIKMVSV